MAKNRVTRKKLLKEPDEFITTTGRIIQWGQKHQQTLTYAAGAFFVLLAVIAGWRYFANQSENTASQLLSQAVVKYESSLPNMGAETAYQAVKADFESLLSRYKRKEAAKMGRVVFAKICYEAGMLDQAVNLYGKALADVEDDNTLKNLILSSLGYAYEKKKDYSQAISYFEQITANNDPLMKDVALFNQGRLYEALGDSVKSQAAFKRLVSDYTESIYFEIAKEKVSG